MTELKRWSDPASEVDPVLRSVLRYAREVGPEPAQLQQLLRAAAPVRRIPPRPPLRLFAAVALAAAFGGVAWAGYSGRLFSAPTPPLPSSAPAVAGPVAPAPVAVTNVEAAPSAVPSVAPARPVPPRASAVASAADFEPSPLLETTLLQQARSSVVSDPGRALTLTRDHELHFPGSALTEERQALRIEALARLGRKAEAVAAFEGFRAQYPRSLYGRKLSALLGL